MARQQGFVVENNFINGLVTQATALSFPENACTETYNCVFDELGKVRRRLGVDLETSFVSADISADYTDQAYVTYTWENVAGDDSVTFIVVQAGSVLHFYRVTTPDNLSGSKHATTIDLTAHDPAGAPDVGLYECQFSDGNGVLFVSGPYIETFYVTYDVSGNSLTATDISIKIRDFELLDDGTTTVDERPTATVATMDADHKYNLFNAGWHYAANAALTAWDAAFTTVPSNADVWWFFRNGDQQAAAADNFTFDTDLVTKRLRGNTPAPRGYYLLPFYDWDRATTSGISGITNNGEDMGTNRITTTAFFAGRVWYAGVNHPGFKTSVLFSQIIEDSKQYGKCYQQNDPTSEDLFDLLPSDGGVLKIPEAGAIVKLWSLENTLVVFSLKGVWTIEGSTGLGFTANDYVVRKISSVPCLTASSFVDVDGIPMWWNEDGVYTLSGPSEDQAVAVRGRLTVRQGNINVISLTDTRISDQGQKSGIKEFLLDIPLGNKKFVKGAYNRSSGLVVWLFRRSEATNATENSIFEEALILNTKTGAWFPWSFDLDPTTVQIKGIEAVQAFGAGVEALNVTAASGVNNVQAASGANEVIVFGFSAASIPPLFKFLIVTDEADMTWADERDTDYLDFESYDDVGIDFDSYFKTGFMVHGDAARFFQGNYIVTYFVSEPNGSCFLRGIWDFASDETSNKFSIEQQVYNPVHTNDMWHVSRSRRKIRGKGRALQLYYYSESGKPFSLVGWSKWETVNAGV